MPNKLYCINIMQLQEERIRQELVTKFKIVRLLGKGSFGNVYECIDIVDNQNYAIKLISKINIKQSKIQNLKEEAKLLKSLKHPNVVKIYEYGQFQSCIYIKMEIAQKGNLQNMIEKRKLEGLTFSDQQISRFMGQIFRGLSYIHSLNIIHRDIKPQNILLANQKNMEQIKIADFGLSTKLDSHYPKSAITKCGTLLFMAPEILCKYSYTKAIDVWSSAIIMFILSNSCHPIWKGNMTTDQYTVLMSKKIVIPSLKNASSLAQDFFNRISKTEPHERYSAQEGLKHPWITRKFQDEIPLAVHESYSSFATANQIVKVAKFFISLRGVFCHNKIEIPSSYLKKLTFETHSKEMGATNSKLKKLKSLNLDKQGSCDRVTSRVEEKSGKQKSRLRIISESDVENPTINKLNQIFNTLFDKKLLAKSKPSYRQNKEDTKQQIQEIPNIDSFKDKIESQLQKCVSQVLQLNKNKNRRILPVQKSPNKNVTIQREMKGDFSLVNKSNFVRKAKLKKKTIGIQQK